MMIITIELDGGVTKVEGLDDINALIVNNSESPVYASRFPGVEPYAQNVIEIPSGARDTVEGANGTVYLLGTGRVECRGVPYVGFKRPSSVTIIGGGNTSSPSVPTEPIAKTLPHTNGLQGVYDWENVDETNGVWNSQIDGESTLELVGDLSKTDDYFRFGNSGLGKCYMENPAHTIYAVMRVSDPYTMNTAYPQFISEVANFQYNNRLSMCLAPANHDTTRGADNGMRLSMGSWGLPNWCPNTYAVDWVICCLTRDENFNFKPYMASRFDYSEWGTISVGANGYKGITLLNSESSNGVTFNPENASIATDWKFFAIGDGIQTPEQIRENIEWLKKKYLT